MLYFYKKLIFYAQIDLTFAELTLHPYEWHPNHKRIPLRFFECKTWWEGLGTKHPSN